MDGQVVSIEEIESIARLPAREVLHAQFVGVLASPVTGLVRGLASLISGLAIQLRAVEEQGLVSGGAAPPAEAAPEEEAEPAPEEQQAEEPQPDEPQADEPAPRAGGGARRRRRRRAIRSPRRRRRAGAGAGRGASEAPEGGKTEAEEG